MPADAILVIDAGTSSLRAASVGLDGAVQPLASEPWEMRTPLDAQPFGREFEPEAVTDALWRLLRAAGDGGSFAAVAFTGQREGLVFLDAADQALYAGPNIDARASAEGIAIDAERGAAVYEATGHLPSLLQAPAKFMWFQRHRPEIAGRVRGVLPLADWLASIAIGARVMSRSLAVENGLLDIRTGAAPPEVARAGLDGALTAPPSPDGAIVGAVRSGDLEGVPVVLAGADTQCALVGAGAIEAGDCGVAAGWSAPVQLVTAAPTFDVLMRTWTGVHVVRNRFVVESNAGETGRVWAWICSLLQQAPGDAAVLAATAPPGADDVMMVHGARVMRASALAAGIGGLTMPLPLAMGPAGAPGVLRSVLESVAFAIRANLEQIEEIAGSGVERMRLGGGMSRMPVFAQIIADVIDRPIELARSGETSALGAAVLAAVALGERSSVAEAVAAMCDGRIVVTPTASDSAIYDDCYGRWCAMADAFERMAGEGA